MNSQLHQLAVRIRDALAEIEHVQRRIQSGWQRVQHSNDDHYLDGVALNLHGFYSGLERIFELVVTDSDSWLKQLTAEERNQVTRRLLASC